MTAILKRMNFNEQDKNLIHYLHEVKVATYEQIKRDIYPDYHFKSVCNRIYRLENNHLVHGWCDRVIGKGCRLISLTKQGFSRFVAKGLEKRIELNSDAIKHDLRLGDIRYRLKRASKVLDYHSENQLQTWPIGVYDVKVGRLANLNCDAVVSVRFPDDTLHLPLEYGASSKSDRRYEPLVKRYYARDDVPAVLYVCENETVLNKISRIETELFPSDQPKFFFKHVSDLFEDETMSFGNCHNFPLKLNQSKG